jgi:uncharacterized protein YkwD
MRRLVALAVVTLALVLPSSGPAAALTAAQTFSRDTINATNRARANHGRDALSRADCVSQYAWAQARRMANQGRMFHQDVNTVLHACHLNLAGENIAYGYETGSQTVNAWMHSSQHRANILKAGYRQIGVGAAVGPCQDDPSFQCWYVSQVFGRRA